MKRKSDEKLMAEFFSGHKARCVDIGEIKMIEWRNPGDKLFDNLHVIKYILVDNKLFVSADIGHAVYEFVGHPDFETIALLDEAQFRCTCQTSYVGVPFIEWDNQLAIDVLDECCSEDEILRLNSTFWFNHIRNRRDWSDYCDLHGGYVFGNEASEFKTIGDATHLSCRLHLLGLRAALAGLADAQGEKKC
jgi:hypothetical protein